MKEFKFELCDESYDLLLKINREGYVEYRNTDEESMFEIMNLIDELYNCGLIDYDNDAWHLTYKMTEFGKKLIQNN